MNKQEQIRMHLGAISRISRLHGAGWRLSNLVISLQEELDAIKGLLEPEPESLASSVLRRTERLRRISYLEPVTAADKAYIKRLREELKWERDMAKQYTYVRLSDTEFRAVNVRRSRKNRQLEQDLCTADARIEDLEAGIAQKNEQLYELQAAVGLRQELVEAHTRTGKLRDEIAKQDRYIEGLQKEIARKNNALEAAHLHLVEVRIGYEEDLVDTVALATRRKKLLADAKKRIEELEQDLATLSRQNWRRGK